MVPEPEDEADLVQQLASAMMELDLTPIYEYAAGQRKVLLEGDWSEETAELAGREILIGLLRAAFGMMSAAE